MPFSPSSSAKASRPDRASDDRVSSVAVRSGRYEPVTVRTGLTDLAYTEVVSGLAGGDEVLLLPSTSLFEQQARLQEFISQRFSSTPFQQQQQGPGRIMLR